MGSYKGLIIFLLCILMIVAPIAILKKHHFRLKQLSSSIPVTLYAKSENKLYRTDLEKYLVGVVAAEMPANFAMEALKAQVVAARTLAIKRLKRFGGKGCQHYAGVDFCDDPSENQAWYSTQCLQTKWNKQDFEHNYRKIIQAVQETQGIIMVYNHQPIDAVFHSTCGVGTADANDVWHHSIPYLKSVDCGFDHHSPHYYNLIKYHWSEFTKQLALSIHSVNEIKIKQRSNQGRVLLISVGKRVYTGEDFRKLFNLTSTCFSILYSARQQEIIFNVVGYGHGVGMCQYGADGMAKKGWGYQRILTHFYQGIRFCRLKYNG